MRFVPAKHEPDKNKDKRRSINFKLFRLSLSRPKESQPEESSTKQTEDLFFPVNKLTLLLSAPCSFPEVLSSNKTHHHLALFIQTDPDANTGYIHHLTGSISSSSGLSYTWQPFSPSNTSTSSPVRSREDEPAVLGSEFLGWTAKATYPEAWETLLRTVEVPKQQIAMNRETGREQVVRVWRDGEPVEWWDEGEGPDVVGCGEWTEMGALPALKNEGLIVRTVD